MKNRLNKFSQYCLEVEGEPPSFDSETELEINEEQHSNILHESFILDIGIFETSCD